MNRIVQLLRKKRVWITTCLFLGGIFLFLLWPSSRMTFAKISNQKDLQLLRGLYLEIQSIEKWTPRYASSDQCDLLVQRIRENSSVKEIRELLRVPEEGMSSQSREALEYQNTLIRELEKSRKLPKLPQLRGMKRDIAQKAVKALTEKIVEEQRHWAIERILHFSEPSPKVKDGVKQVQTRIMRIQNIFWKNDLEYCPEKSNGWFGISWRSMDRWVYQFQKAVEKDVLPLLQWYQDIENYNIVNLQESPSGDYLQLRLTSTGSQKQASFVKDGWYVRGNYTLFACSTEQNMVREFDTGIRHTPLQLIPDQKKFPYSKISTRSSRELYSHQTREPIHAREGFSTYHPFEVSSFLYQLGVPSGFSIRVSKVSTDHFLDDISIFYYLEHPDVQGWKSSVYTLKIEAKNCLLDSLRSMIVQDMETAKQDFWKFTSSHLKKLKQFPCKILSLKANNQIYTELSAGKIRLPWMVAMDETAQFRYFCNASPENMETLLERIYVANRELEKLKGFLSVDSLVLDKNITGRCVISPDLLNQTKFDETEEIAFDFWIHPDGTLDTNCLTALRKLSEQELVKFPEPKEEMSPELLKNRIEAILEEQYPTIASHVLVQTGNNATVKLYYKLFLEIADYPTLDLGTRAFVDDTTLQTELAESLDGSSSGGVGFAVQERWEKYEHPFYGEIQSQLSEWNPRSPDQCVGMVKNTFYPAKSSVGFSWNEPLTLDENDEWLPRDWNQVSEQLRSQWEPLCNAVVSIVQELYEVDFQINPEMEEDWIQHSPLKFSMMAQWTEPFGLPFHFEVGKIRVTAKEVEFPKRFHLRTSETFWLTSMGISSPRLDIDFEKKQYSAGLSITPPLASLGKDIPDEGYSLDTYESPEISPEEYSSLFGNESGESTENPWLQWVRMDIQGNFDGMEKEIGLGGALISAGQASASASGTLAPSRFSGSLSTRDAIYDEVSDVSLPLNFEGNFAWIPDQTQFGANVNLSGYSGAGEIFCQTKENAKYNGSFAAPLPFTIPQVAMVGGEVSPDMERYQGEATGMVIHPFISLGTGTLRYGLRMWKQSETDNGCKLIFEWFMPDGRRATFEKEYPNASSLTPEEIEKEVREEYERLLQEKDFMAPKANASETEQFAKVGQAYPEVSSSDATEKSNGENERLKNLLKPTVDRTLSQILPQKTDSETDGENQICLITGEVRHREENGKIILEYVDSGKMLFSIDKIEAGLQSDENVSEYYGCVGTAQDGSGTILFVSIKSLCEGLYPRFLKISCDSPQSVKKSEEIFMGSSLYHSIRPLFPNPLSSDIRNDIPAIRTALKVLWEESCGCQVSNVCRNGDGCYYDNDTLEQTFLCYLVHLQDKIQDCIIPHEVIPNVSTRSQVIEYLLDPKTVSSPSEHVRVGGYLSHDDTYSLLLFGINEKGNDLIVQFFTPQNPVTIGALRFFIQERYDLLLPYCKWMLQQYVSRTVPHHDAVTEFFLGDAGIAISETKTDNVTQNLYLISELNVSDTQYAPEILCFEDWKAWRQDTVRFLPQEWQREEVRENVPFSELASMVVQSWSREDSKDVQKWRASPLGLLISLAENKKLKN